MKMFGKLVKLNEDEVDLDMDVPRLVLLEDGTESTDYALSDEYDKAAKDKADKAWRDKAVLDGRKTIICDTFWDDFLLLSKVCLLRNPEADLYDVFETIRTKFLGGWGFSESYLAKVDEVIAREEGPWLT